MNYHSLKRFEKKISSMKKLSFNELLSPKRFNKNIYFSSKIFFSNFRSRNEHRSRRKRHLKMNFEFT
jgi:hypothetical protein